MKNFFTQRPRTAAMVVMVLVLFIRLVLVVVSNPQLLDGLPRGGGACVWQDGIRYCR
ncbi:MAG: hypothetical protein AABZ00_05025 [Chloroflexota bacterium]